MQEGELPKQYYCVTSALRRKVKPYPEVHPFLIATLSADSSIANEKNLTNQEVGCYPVKTLLKTHVKKESTAGAVMR